MNSGKASIAEPMTMLLSDMMILPEIGIAVQAALDAGQSILKSYGQDIQPEYKSDNTPLTIADRSSHELILRKLEETGLPILSEEGIPVPYAERKAWPAFWMVDPLDGTREFLARNGEFTVNIALISAGQPVLGVIYAPAKGQLYFASTKAGAFYVDAPNDTIHSTEQLMESARRMPFPGTHDSFRIVASRSHMDEKTLSYLERLRENNPDLDVLRCGSSLKFCMVASGEVNSYPRFSPTMEWDTAAGHAILNAAGRTLIDIVNGRELLYNKEDLHNPGFIAQ